MLVVVIRQTKALLTGVVVAAAVLDTTRVLVVAAAIRAVREAVVLAAVVAGVLPPEVPVVGEARQVVQAVQLVVQILDQEAPAVRQVTTLLATHL